MKRNEMKLLLEERFERIALLETRIDTLEQLIEGYREREQAVLDTLQAAKENAAKMAQQAEQEAEEMREEARRSAGELQKETAMTAEALKSEAESLVREMLSNAKAESERMLRDAEIIKREYEEMSDAFNAMLEQNASELQTTTARFAEFLKKRKIEPPETIDDGTAFYKSVGALNDAPLPDPGDDPSRLMQNIYRIQNRPLPENPMQADSADGENASAAEPYSEAAWSSEFQTSESEPQAEFTKVFDEAYTATEFTVSADGCHLDAQETDREIDALLSDDAILSGSADAQEAPEPSTAAGVSEGDHTNAQHAFDEFYHENFNNNTGEQSADTIGDDIQPDVMREEPQEQVSPIDELDALLSKQIPETPEVSQQSEGERLLVIPEPYTEAAWAQRILKSDREAQAALLAANMAKEIPDATLNSGLVDGDALRAFDDFLDEDADEADDALTEEPAAEPEPFSEAAWAQEAYTSELEPQAEFSTAFGSQTADAAIDTAAPTTAADAERAFDELMSGKTEPEPVQETETPDPNAAPEPFSEAAWAEEAYTSEQEPQAEFTAAFGAIDNARESESTPTIAPADVEQAFEEQMDAAAKPEEPETAYESEFQDEEPAPEPRRYNEYGEVREWEPEPEPEMEEIPTVSNFMGADQAQEEVSLDQLLDEIIKAGD